MWCIKLADLGFKKGIRFAIAEIASAKSVHHQEIETGIWDDLITVMNAYRGHHIFTFHEYTTGILPASLLPDYPLNLNKPAIMHRASWQSAKLNLSTIAGNYHLGRGALITHVRAKQLGYAPLPFVITECAFDWMEDINNSPERQAVIDPLRQAFKPDNHDALRGSTGHEPYHRWLMQKAGFQGDWNDYLFAQYEWMVNAYPDECEGFCIFALNRDWDLPEGHDMSLGRNDGFRHLVMSTPLPRTQETPDMEELIFDPPLYDADVYVTSGYWNLRAEMSDKSADLGDLTQTPIRMKVSKTTNSANGYDWYKYSRDTGLYVEHGYLADADKLKIDYVVEEAPDPEPEPDAPDIGLPEIGLPEIEDMIQKALDPMLQSREIDIPLPAFTMTVPTILIEPLAQYFDGLSGVYSAMAQRLRSGTPTTSQIANEIYATVDLPGEDDNMLDELLNGGVHAA